MVSSALTALINALPAYANEAKKKPSKRQPIVYGATRLDFSILSSLIETTHYRLSRIISSDIERLDKRLKKFILTYPNPLSHQNPRFEDYLRDLAEAIKIELDLEETSKHAQEVLAKQKKDPLGALSEHLQAVKKAHQMYQQERAKRLQALRPALRSVLQENKEFLSQVLSALSLTETQITSIQQELISLPSQVRKQRLLAILKAKDFRDLPAQTATKVDQLIGQTTLVARLKNEAINQVFHINVREQLATNAIMLLPLEIIKDKQALFSLLKATTDEAVITGILPKEELQAQMVKVAAENNISLPVNYQGFVDQIVELTTTKIPTQPMLVEPLSQIFAGYQAYNKAKEEVNNSLSQAKKRLPGLKNRPSHYLERMIDMAIEASLLTAYQLREFTDIGDLETQVAQGIRQTLARHNVSLPERELREIFKKITYRIETSPAGIGMRKAIGQAVDETTDDFSQLDQVIKPDGTRLSAVLTTNLAKAVQIKPEETDYLVLAQNSLAKILAQYNGILSAEQQQALIDRVINHIRAAKPGVNIEGVIEGSVYLTIKDLIKTDSSLKQIFDRINPSGKKFVEEFTVSLTESLKLTQAQNLPSGQKDIALALAVRASLDHTLYQIALKESEAIIGNPLLVKTPALISYLKSETDAGELFRRNLVINLEKKRTGIFERIGVQLTLKDEKFPNVKNLLTGKAGKAAGIFTAAVMILGKIAPGIVNDYGEQADSEEEKHQALEEAKRKKQIETGLAIPIGILNLYLNRKKILLYLRKRIPFLRKIIALRRLKRWQELAAAKQTPPTTPVRWLTRLRFYRLRGKISLGSVFLAGLQARFPNFFIAGNFILSRQGLSQLLIAAKQPRGILFRYRSLFRNIRFKFTGLFQGGFGKGLISITSTGLRGIIGLAGSVLGSLSRTFSPVLNNLAAGRFDQLVSLQFNQMKRWAYIIAIIVILFFFIISPPQQMITQTAFVAPIGGVMTKEDYEEEFPTKPGGVPDFTAKDRLVPCDDSKEISIPETEKHLFTGLGKTNRCITPEIIVIHWSGGTRGNQRTYEYLNSHQNGYSCQLATDSTGTWQMLQFYENSVEYGRCTGGIDPNSGYSYNSLSINIEMNGVDFDSNPPPETEIAETIKVTCWVLKKYLVPKFGNKSFNKVFAHFQLTQGKPDPGKNFFKQFKQRLIKECPTSSLPPKNTPE